MSSPSDSFGLSRVNASSRLRAFATASTVYRPGPGASSGRSIGFTARDHTWRLARNHARGFDDAQCAKYRSRRETCQRGTGAPAVMFGRIARLREELLRADCDVLVALGSRHA